MLTKLVFVYIFAQFLNVIIEGVPLNQQAKLVVPKCNSSNTFCEEVEIYPKDTFYKFLQDSSYEEYLQTEEEPLGPRFHPDSDYNLCHSVVKTRYPQTAVNTRHEWKFVYNFDKYQQRLVTEECVSAHKPCKPLHDAPKNVKTECIQKYNDKLFLVADKDGKPVWDLFWFPSACVCSYQPKIKFHRFHS